MGGWSGFCGDGVAARVARTEARKAWTSAAGTMPSRWRAERWRIRWKESCCHLSASAWRRAAAWSAVRQRPGLLKMDLQTDAMVSCRPE
jgi:hypothetical protein